MSSAPRYESEAALCDAFTVEARAEGWTVYPETSGWDLLLVRGDEQVGVEAKLRCNLEVLCQALTPGEHRKGPSRHAVLVPKASGHLITLAAALGVGVASMADIARQHELDGYRKRYGMGRKTVRLFVRGSRHWDHPSPAWLPPVVPTVAAGVPSPVSLTRWRVQAIKMCILLESADYVTTADFKSLDISHTLWVERGWIVSTGKRIGRRIMYVRGASPSTPFPTDGFTDETEQIRAMEAR